MVAEQRLFFWSINFFLKTDFYSCIFDASSNSKDSFANLSAKSETNYNNKPYPKKKYLTNALFTLSMSKINSIKFYRTMKKTINEGIPNKFRTSDFSPYITKIGLANDDGELLNYGTPMVLNSNYSGGDADCDDSDW